MRRLAPAIALAFLAAAPEAAAQCAMCRTALTSSAEGQAIAAQFNAAILVMLAAPYLILGALAGVFFRQRLRDLLGRRLARLRARG